MADKTLLLRAGEQLVYESKLRKLVDKRGNIIPKPKFRMFYIVKDVARATTWLIHQSGNGDVKRVEISPICQLEVATAPNSLGGPVFKLKVPKVVDMLYEAECEWSYEKWCCCLQILIQAKERIIAIDIPSNSPLPYNGPALMTIKESCVMIRQPSSLSLLHSFPVLIVTSFGADTSSEWIALCRACARTRRSADLFSFTPPSIDSRQEFLQELKRFGEMMTGGLWAMPGSVPDNESYFVDHAKVCQAGNVWDIRFRREFLEEVVAPLFSEQWEDLAIELGYRVVDIAMFRDQPNPSSTMFQYWGRKSSAYDSEPKELIRAARQVGMVYEANKLLHHMLIEQTTVEEPHYVPGPKSPPSQHRKVVKRQSSKSLHSPSLPKARSPLPSHASPSSSPSPSPSMKRLSYSPAPRTPSSMDRGQLSPPPPSGSASPGAESNPLLDRNLYRLATKIARLYPDNWKMFAYELGLSSPTIQAIARNNDSLVERTFQCLQAWKTLPYGSVPSQLVEALGKSEMTELATEVQEEIKRNPLYYAEADILPQSLETHQQSPKQGKMRIARDSGVDELPPPDLGYVRFHPNSS